MESVDRQVTRGTVSSSARSGFATADEGYTSSPDLPSPPRVLALRRHGETDVVIESTTDDQQRASIIIFIRRQLFGA